MILIVLASVIALSDAQVVGIFTPINITNPKNYNNNPWPALPNNNNRGIGWVNPQTQNRAPGWVNPQTQNQAPGWVNPQTQNQAQGWVNPQPQYPPAFNNNNVNMRNSTGKPGSSDTLFGTCTGDNELLLKTLITKPSSAWNPFSSTVKEISFPDINSSQRVRTITCIKVKDNAKTKIGSSSITGGGIGAKYVKMRFKSPNSLDFGLEIYGYSDRL